MPPGSLRILVSRHSAFYTPLIATVAGGFLAEEGLEASYGVLPTGRSARDLIRAGEVDIVQAAVSSNWGPMEKGESDLPVHFAQINSRDGYGEDWPISYADLAPYYDKVESSGR